MYRKEEEALRARLEALESELSAETELRQEAETEAREAKALARELAREKGKAGGAPVKKASQWVSILALTLLSMVVAVGYQFFARSQKQVKVTRTMTEEAVRQAQRSNLLEVRIKKAEKLNEELMLRLRRAEDRKIQKRLKAELDNLEGSFKDSVAAMGGKKKTALVDQLMKLADAKLTSGQPTQARNLAQVVLGISPKHSAALRISAVAACLAKDRRGALALWPRVDTFSRSYVRSMCATQDISLPGSAAKESR